MRAQITTAFPTPCWSISQRSCSTVPRPVGSGTGGWYGQVRQAWQCESTIIGSAPDSRLAEPQVRARVPPEFALRLREVVIPLVLVAGDEEGAEAAVPGADSPQRSEIGVRQVFLV